MGRNSENKTTKEEGKKTRVITEGKLRKRCKFKHKLNTHNSLNKDKLTSHIELKDLKDLPLLDVVRTYNPNNPPKSL